MKAVTRIAVSSLLVLPVLLALACAPKDPRAKVLQERADWNVQLQSWASGEQGLTLGVRLSGPVHASLDQLTFRVDMRDAQGNVIGSHWWTQDVSSVQRGNPTDFLIKLPATDLEIDALSIDQVLSPSDEDAARIKELQGLATG